MRDLDKVFSVEDEVIVYRIVQECVSNIVKHSEAANAFVTIENAEREIVIKIADDGRGFVAETLSGAGKNGGFGLNGLNERVKMLGGFIQIESSPGAGTTTTVKIPNSFS